jgi:hypothetical protein
MAQEELDAILGVASVDVSAIAALVSSADEPTRRLIFEQMRSRLGSSEASRVWLVIFAASDASQT